jgi:hypothetical protein
MTDLADVLTPNLGADLEKLAQAVVKDALQDGVPLETRLEVLKYATTYFIGVTKIADKMKDEDDESMGGFARRIDESAKTEGNA